MAAYWHHQLLQPEDHWDVENLDELDHLRERNREILIRLDARVDAVGHNRPSWLVALQLEVVLRLELRLRLAAEYRMQRQHLWQLVFLSKSAVYLQLQ